MKRIILLALLALPLAGCNIVRVAEYSHHFKAERGDIVEVVMDMTVPGADQRCLDMGGVPIIDAAGLPICWNINF